MRVTLKDGDWYEPVMTGELSDDGRECGAALIFDGHRGHYIYGEIVALAVRHGFPLADADKAEIAAAKADAIAYDGPAGTESIIFMSEHAEDYLNDQLTDKDWSFGWHDGEYFLANAAWWSLDS